MGGRIRGALGVRTKEEKKTKRLKGPGRRKKKEKKTEREEGLGQRKKKE